MKVLVACEYSGVVRDAFIKRGHDAISCDLLPTDSPGPHYQGDVFDIIDAEKWDLMIAHPPCTYICRNAANHIITQDKIDKRKEGIDFFNSLKNANINKICLENPVPSQITREKIGMYSQIIQPYQFGHDYSKKTCLWLQNLPLLQPTKIIDITYYITPNGKKYTYGWYFTPRNSHARSKTFQGIADAMADQWGQL